VPSADTLAIKAEIAFVELNLIASNLSWSVSTAFGRTEKS